MDMPVPPLSTDDRALWPAASFLSYDSRADGWTVGRQAAFLMHLADHGVVADAARAVGKSLGGAYALRRQARGYAFNLGWEAALVIARRIVVDKLMACAIEGERAQWVRVDGCTTYTRFSAKIATTLLDRVTPVSDLAEVMAVVARFDTFVSLLDQGASPAQTWALFFDAALSSDDREARNRVRSCLLLSEESADFDDDDDDDGACAVANAIAEAQAEAQAAAKAAGETWPDWDARDWEVKGMSLEHLALNLHHPSLRAERGNLDSGAAGLPRFVRNDDPHLLHCALGRESGKFRTKTAERETAEREKARREKGCRA
jgi:hypothetical protein